ncbi:MAG: hypothetical protein UX08_C0022G0008 [Candidatus Collierbacteria bacterium GW2011_GWB1_45_35]|uniref:Uncharacterized protein n=1 Tax=Candidatus Collierbacteria bacterium GW2011_GWA2_44_99 TaxID=1618380 RepID=A0A0G1KRY6_9BACT|nr:MAG: hypothetical protein UW84_C0014G0002 [Candidatus Collierbacteria bacterium GW2011_GWA2_44_99]KKU04570.1 MAG: hypothetical protein UX08_C0022G0008 [Candidatus Collierbacteria bacterium GW2011_GWB1_45_35]KKU07043.1 MAG: hypothetical protein UX11_C0021G0008 [Candidatus Collierbacteria bacterium GW2011_GWC2_45_40]
MGHRASINLKNLDGIFYPNSNQTPTSIDSVGINEEANGGVPELAGVEDQVRAIVGDPGACFG